MGMTAQAQEGGDVEELVVRGIRSSLERSVDIKRESGNIVESITADDIGKMPDQNIAESLQRLPGIQIDRRDGEGTRVRIRGLDQNLTLINGETFTAGMEYFQMGEARVQFNDSLESIPSELLGGVDVFKSPTASMIEGAMGGVVNLKTREALDLDGLLVAANVKLDQGLDAEEAEPSGFVVIGNNWDDTFGAIFSLTANRKTVHTDIIQNFSRENTGVRCTEGGEYGGFETGCVVDADDPLDPVDTVDLTLLGQSYIAPGMFYVTDTQQERERIGSAVNLQWQPSDALKFSFDWFHSDLDIENRQYSVKHPMNTDNAAGIDESRPFSIFGGVGGGSVGILQSGTVNVPGAEVNSGGDVTEVSTDNFALRGEWDAGNSWRFSAALTGAESELEQRGGFSDSRFTPYNFTTFVGVAADTTGANGWEHAAANPGTGGPARSYTYQVGDRPDLAFTNPAWLTDPDFLTFKSHWALGSDSDTEKSALRFDVERDMGWGDMKVLKFGARAGENEVSFTDLRYLSDFSQTVGAMSPTLFNEDGTIAMPTTFDPTQAPGAGAQNAGVREAVYYDLCGNGGIKVGDFPGNTNTGSAGFCDIDGDGITDNFPAGPLGYFMDAAIGLKAFDLMTSNGTPMSTLLYGPTQAGNARFNGSPGYLPWQTFNDNPGRSVSLTNFFASGGYQSNVLMDNSDAIVADVEGWIDGITPNTPGQWYAAPLNSFEVKESTTAFYVEAEFEGDTVPYTLNVGVRAVETEVDVTSAQISNPQAAAEQWTEATDIWNSQGVLLEGTYEIVTNTRDYWDVLPSLNFVLDTSDETKLRFAMARVIARPSARDLGTGFSRNFTRVNDDPNPGDVYFGFTGGNAGNPQLDPFRASQADIAYEWYFDELGLMSLGAFIKSVDSFIATETRLEFGEDAGPGGGRLGGVSRPQNGSGGSVKGLELQYQQAWDSGFGGAFNYTYSDSEVDAGSTINPDLGLPGVSESAYNIIGFFENDTLSARLAYAWRDKYLSPIRSVFDVGGLENGASEFFDAYGQWDASVTWDFAENISLNGELINITGEEQTTYLGYAGQPMTYTSQEPRLILGINYRL